MAWNEPGNKGDEKDPWTGKAKKKANAPAIEQQIKKLQNTFLSFLKKQPPDGNNNSSASDNNGHVFAGALIILVALVCLWFLAGIFIVQPAERAVVLQFGKYDRTMGPGIHWIPRFISSYQKIDVAKIYALNYPANEDARMLTRDENIIDVAVTIKYRVNNPYAFLYNVVDPIGSLNQATASALRQVIGNNNFDAILTTGRDNIRQNVKTQLVQILSRYNSGIEIIDVSLKSAKAPDEVKAAFDDAIKAREDEQTYINQAETYAMQVTPIAQGQAQRILEAAKAYQQKVVLQSKADTADFLAILPLYKEAPGVTSERLYLSTLEKVLSGSNKILIDSKNNNNLMYLPLDKLLANNNSNNVTTIAAPPQPPMTATPAKTETNNRPQRDQTSGYGSGGPYE